MSASAEDDDQRRPSGSATNSPGKDGLDRVELSDLDASPPRLPVEQDLMQLSRLGEIRGVQRLFDSGKYNAKSTDEQGITALHVGDSIYPSECKSCRLIYNSSGRRSMVTTPFVTFSFKPAQM